MQLLVAGRWLIDSLCLWIIVAHVAFVQRARADGPCMYVVLLQDQSVPVVELVRPEGAAAACGVIQPGHTMISVNDKTLLGMSLPQATRFIAEAASKTKESNGKIPCTVRFLKTEVPPVKDAPANSPKGKAAVASPKAQSPKAGNDKKASGDAKAGGCFCFGKNKDAAAAAAKDGKA